MALRHAHASPTIHGAHNSDSSYAAPSDLSLRRDQDRLHLVKESLPSSAEAHDEYSRSSNSFVDIDITGPIRPPPSAITTSNSATAAATATAYDPHQSPSPLDRDYANAGLRIGHQRSLTNTWLDNCQPFLDKATSTLQQHTSKAALSSPTKTFASFISSRGGLEAPSSSPPKFAAGAKALQSWFNGASAPAKLGLAHHDHPGDEYDSEEDDREEQEGSNMMSSIFAGGSRTPKLTNSTSNASDNVTPKQSPQPKHVSPTSASSKFSWLLSTPKNSSNAPPPSISPYHNPSDELLNLNVSTSLFPHGPADPLDPASFHALLSNSESILTRFQSSYRHLSTALADTRAEQDAQNDELEEAKTRVLHFKMQLETLAARASDQDTQIQRLMDDLALERRARQEAEEEVARTHNLLRGPPAPSFQPADQSALRRRNRVSNSDMSVDSGFESECDSEAASIFSRTNCMSPTGTHASSAASVTDSEGAFDVNVTPKGKQSRVGLPSAMAQQRSAGERSHAVSFADAGWGCANCEGGAQSAVWGRLAREREENAGLRRRVEGLEEAVEGALRVVEGGWRI